MAGEAVAEDHLRVPTSSRHRCAGKMFCFMNNYSFVEYS